MTEPFTVKDFQLLEPIIDAVTRQAKVRFALPGRTEVRTGTLRRLYTDRGGVTDIRDYVLLISDLFTDYTLCVSTVMEMSDQGRLYIYPIHS
jgi:hypothetical protein